MLWVNTRNSHTKSFFLNQTETYESMCWRTVLLCFCGSRLLHHLSQAWSVQQRGTCIAWTWKWFNSEAYSYTLTIFTVFCGSESNSYRRSNGCRTSKRTLSCFFVSVKELTFSHESGHRFQRLESETACFSDLTPSMWICLYCMCRLGFCVYSICICAGKCVCVCVNPFSFVILSLDLQSRMTLCL